MLFRYEATDSSGKIFLDKIDATGQDEALLFLGRRGLIPIKIDIDLGHKNRLSLSTGFFERVKVADRIALVRNLSVMLKAGLNVIEAVDILIVDTNKKVLRDILQSAKASLEKGQPLSATFSEYNKIFSPVFVGLLEAGEASGHLDAALEQLAEQMDKEYKLARKVKSALAYPTILLLASILVVSMMLIFVLPRLARSFKMSGVELPLITRIIMAVSTTISSHLLLFGLAIVGLVAAFGYFRKTRFGGRLLLRLVLRIPVVKELVKKIALVRFSRNLSSLIGSGLNIIEALQISASTVGNLIYKEKILSSIAQIKNGIALSDTIKNETRLFPHLLVNMIEVGEKTGTLEYVLKTFADFYEEEVDNALKDLTTYLEPLMLLFMGALIGTIALSILLPIYQLIGKFS